MIELYAATVTAGGVADINGVFATTLDFGAPPFDIGAARYMVRCRGEHILDLALEVL